MVTKEGACLQTLITLHLPLDPGGQGGGRKRDLQMGDM